MKLLWGLASHSSSRRTLFNTTSNWYRELSKDGFIAPPATLAKALLLDAIHELSLNHISDQIHLGCNTTILALPVRLRITQGPMYANNMSMAIALVSFHVVGVLVTFACDLP